MYGMILGNRYEILNKVGEGGMAEVYKARCNKLNRFVAVKILKPEFADNEEIAEKFQREATAVANLSDTNIVNVLDVGNQDDMNFIVMEYVEGRTLKDVIRSVGKIIPSVAIDVAIQVARGLDCAHKNNIIHRDIKPQNILVNEEGHIKVADFGIAKSVGASTITNTTTIMGSAHYLSPEQAKGGYIDCRTDLYSLGIVLYEMVTGELPFDGDSAVTIALKHLQEQVRPPKELNPELSDSLNQLIMKAVDKDPAYRYQTAKEMILDLQKVKGNPNAAIYDKQEDDQRTVIMAPINPDELQQTQGFSSLQNGYYEDEDEDEYDEDDYDDDYEDDYDDYSDAPNKKGGKKGGNKGLIIGSVIGLILLLCVGGYGLWKTLGGGNKKEEAIKVPEIKGLTIKEAKKKVEDIGLELVDKGDKNSSRPKGTIISGDPSEGSEVKKGDKVEVYTSNGEAGSKDEELMDLAGMPRDEAEEYLDSIGIGAEKRTFKTVKSDDVPENHIISTNPSEGTPIEEIESIVIEVSGGAKKKKVAVPNVRGQSEKDARKQLEADGFKVSVEYQEGGSDSRVISQDPSAGELEIGSTVTIIVTKPKQKTNVRQIIHEGMTLQQAMTALNNRGIPNETNKPYDTNRLTDYIVDGFTPQEVGTNEIVILNIRDTNPNGGNNGGNNNGGDNNGGDNNSENE